jgi:poly-gamma-glutamate capsule biosynthesis protein CapA/YwtB (metallophosphatase superfamily)
VTIDEGDLARVKADIAALRPKVDVVVVSHHNRDGSTPVQFDGKQGTFASKDRKVAEAYQRTFAHAVLDAGADLVFGHGTHTVQGVEVYKGKPILYAIGHSTFDQPGYEHSTDGLVVRTVIKGKRIVRVSFVPVTRDEKNDVHLLDPAAGEGATLAKAVRDRSPVPVDLRIDGKEVVLLDAPPTATAR